MIAKIDSAIAIGMNVYQVEVETDITGFSKPKVIIVGLPDQAVRESKDRILTAIKNSKLNFDVRNKIVINLAPADLKKEGPIFDLPIAISMLAAKGYVKKDLLDKFAVVGELALNGSLRPIQGALPIALSLKGKKEGLILPEQNQAEASLQEYVKIFPIKNLRETVKFLNGEIHIKESSPYDWKKAVFNVKHNIDFSDIVGQYAARRAAEVAVSGGHNIMMIGPPGSGKTMIAERIPTIMPKMSKEEALEVMRIYSVASKAFNGTPRLRRPFRAPHHTASQAALIGGGSVPRPGEVTLAHNGVLFLDELAEFNRSALEVLRLPLENRSVTIARAKDVMTFPAKFMLVCATNPCPCGYYNDAERECKCSYSQIQKYMSKISGPLMDRIDIHFAIKRIKAEHFRDKSEGESSSAIRERVERTRELQRERFYKLNKVKKKRIYTNSDMGVKEIKAFCKPNSEGEKFLISAVKELLLSARGYHKVLKVARTIADMRIISGEKKESELIGLEEIAEALQYRMLDKDYVKG